MVVHRLLAAAIGVAPLPEALMSKGKQHELADNMNRRHKAAQVRAWFCFMCVCVCGWLVGRLRGLGLV